MEAQFGKSPKGPSKQTLPSPNGQWYDPSLQALPPPENPDRPHSRRVVREVLQRRHAPSVGLPRQNPNRVVSPDPFTRAPPRGALGGRVRPGLVLRLPLHLLGLRRPNPPHLGRARRQERVGSREDPAGALGLGVLCELQSAVEPDRVRVLRRDDSDMGGEDREVPPRDLCPLHARHVRELQSGRLAHRLRQPRWHVQDLGLLHGHLAQDAHRRQGPCRLLL